MDEAADLLAGPWRDTLNAAPMLRAEVVSGPDGPPFAVAPPLGVGSLRQSPRSHTVSFARPSVASVAFVNGFARVPFVVGAHPSSLAQRVMPGACGA